MAITLAQALNTALHDAMEADDKVVMFGEDVGKLGGVFRITDKLQERFGDSRCFDTPLAESGIVGTAIGMAMYGYKPVVEMQFDGFTYPAFEQIVSHLAKYRNRSRGTVNLPVVVRIPYGGGIGAVEHHSESPEAYFAHTAGLKVVSPGTPSDAYSLLREAIEGLDPVIFFEPKRRYWLKEEAELPTKTEPIGRAVVRREGTTATLVGYGPMTRTCMEAAAAAEDEGWDLEVIDLRSLTPFDTPTILESIKKTGRLIVVHEASVFCGFGAEIAARMTERAFYHLEAPVLRVGGWDTPYPPAMLEEYFLPDTDRILDAVERSLGF
jgi:2-oxoisovalerate dehydrogenase E1 component beta subunit